MTSFNDQHNQILVMQFTPNAVVSNAVVPPIRPKAWFDEDQSQTRRELLCKLQAAYPDTYPDALLRTVCSAA